MTLFFALWLSQINFHDLLLFKGLNFVLSTTFTFLGLKFRHGARYGRLTYNAREIGVEISPTWGGAVSLLFR